MVLITKSVDGVLLHNQGDNCLNIGFVSYIRRKYICGMKCLVSIFDYINNVLPKLCMTLSLMF